MNMEQKTSYSVIGVMSGTSLDGLDLVISNFRLINGHWSFEITDAQTVNYPESIIEELRKGIHLKSDALNKLDKALGEFIGKTIKDSFGEKLYQIDFIASHGHTIFHQPEKGVTVQIGCGEEMNRITSKPVVNDFRSLDVSLGGQGAPLVPVGDRDLFHEFDYCLNLGGIANITQNQKISAFDICPFNMALNALAEKKNLAYDDGGQLANSGKLLPTVLEALSNIPYNKVKGPKSLGAEDYELHWKAIIEGSEAEPQDLMNTYCEYAAIAIAKVVNKKPGSKLLVTGGGAFHTYFINRLKGLVNGQVIIPTEELISFKEALIFAYLGLLRVLKQPNCLASVTGAKQDNCGGNMIGFKNETQS